MAALGAPIANDALYPVLLERAAEDYSAPLQLLAKRLSFIDPLSGDERTFASNFRLQQPDRASCTPDLREVPP